MAYDTQLTPEQEQAYQTWKAQLPPNLQNDQDYDLRGAFLASAKSDGRMHMTDQFKKPNHVTFSDGSQYSTPAMQGGHWADTGSVNALAPDTGNSWNFWASQQNMQNMPMNALADYFKRSEPGNAVIFPLNYKLPRGK